MLPGAAAAAARLRRGPARRLQPLPPAGPYGDLRGALCADGAGHPAALRLGRGMTETATGSFAGERIGFGIGCAVAGLFGMSVMDACAKFLGDDYAVSQVILARNGVGAIAILAFVLLGGGGLACLKPKRPIVLVLRTAVNLATSFLYLTALRYLPLADTFAIAFAAPPFITALSVPVLGERVGLRRWRAVMIGRAH